MIAKPPVSVSTKTVYEKLDALDIVKHPNIDGILEGLEEQNLEKITSNMGNVLEEVTIGDYPVIEKIKKVMQDAGALNAMMSGSGPTVFGILRTERRQKRRMRK